LIASNTVWPSARTPKETSSEIEVICLWRDNLDEKFAAHGRAILAVAAA
jgi:hypothetical protein